MSRYPFERTTVDDGSLPLTLLAIIVVSGIIAVLFMNVLSSQSQVRFDRDFAEALPVADAGVEVTQFRLNNGDTLTAEGGQTYERADFPVGASTAEESRTINGETYTWTVTRLSTLDWEVVSVAEISGTTRRIVATLQDEPWTTMAAFTDELLQFRGGNAANSYNSSTGAWCTWNGIVGSNEDVVFSGGGGGGAATCDRSVTAGPGRTVDRVDLYDWEANPGANPSSVNPGGERCDGGFNHKNCREVAEFEAPRTIDRKLDLAAPEEIAFISEAIEACKVANGGTLDNFRTSESSGELAPQPNAEQAVLEGDMSLEGGHHCFGEMNFDQDTPLAADASAHNPVIIFVEREVFIKGQGSRSGGASQVGCANCSGSWSPPSIAPEAAALRIFVLDGPISVGNHAAFAGVLYGPRADCGGSSANAQADIYGSIICETISNQGGWKFHFDDALLDIGSGQFTVGRWREERP